MKRQPMKRSKRSDGKARSGESKIEFRGEEKAAIEARSGGRCEAGTIHCTGIARVIHHRLMKSHGGRGDRDNGLHACSACHLYIHQHPAESYRMGWLIRGAAQGVAFTNSE